MIGNDSPSCTGGICFGLMPVSFCAVSCDKRDTDEPESSMISVLMSPTLPTILALCDLIVATTWCSWGLLIMGTPTAPCRHPSSVSLPTLPCQMAWSITDVTFLTYESFVEYVPVCYSKNNA